MKTLGLVVDILGWLGCAILIAAYGLISYGSEDGRGLRYQTLNITGSILLILNTTWQRAWPSSMVNVVWVGIAIGALIRGLKTRYLLQVKTGASPESTRL